VANYGENQSSPLDLCMFTEFGPYDRLRFAGVILERLIFRTPEVIAI